MLYALADNDLNPGVEYSPQTGPMSSVAENKEGSCLKDMQLVTNLTITATTFYSKIDQIYYLHRRPLSDI